MAGARAYDGTRYMTIPTSIGIDNINKLTIAMWMYRSTASSNAGDVIVSKGSSTGRTLLELYYLSGSSSWYCGVNNSAGHASVAYSGTGWHHVAMTYDGSNPTQASRVKLWIDGTQLAFTGGSNTPGSTTQTNGTVLEVGRDSGATSAKSGSGTGIAHFQVFNAELTQIQIQNLMWYPGSPPVSPLAYYPMLTTGATTEPEVCGNFDGTWQSSVADLVHGPNVSFGRGGI